MVSTIDGRSYFVFSLPLPKRVHDGNELQNNSKFIYIFIYIYKYIYPYIYIYIWSASRVARSKIQNSENFFSTSENRQNYFPKIRNKSERAIFLQMSGYHVEMLVSTTLLDPYLLIDTLFSKLFY